MTQIMFQHDVITYGEAVTSKVTLMPRYNYFLEAVIAIIIISVLALIIIKGRNKKKSSLERLEEIRESLHVHKEVYDDKKGV